MSRLKTLSTLILLSNTVLLYACTTAQLNISGSAPAAYQDELQPIQLFSCNTYDKKYSVSWEGIALTLPYGNEVRGEDSFYINKYYIASPPLPNMPVPGKPVVLGLLDNDHFTFDQANEKVSVTMNYQLLQPVYLNDLSVSFGDLAVNCEKLGLCKIPVNTRCPAFPYQPVDGEILGIGKGIGLLDKNAHGFGKIFLPFTDEALQNPLQCTVSILNDIIQNHKIYFDAGNGLQEEISLTEAYLNQNKQPVKLVIEPRLAAEPAMGCINVDD